MEENKNVLAFSVNETLLLEKGQAIEEMLAISLEPDIAIETYHDYVQIRGIIILQGEYKKAESIEHSESEIMMNYVEKIIDTEPGQAMFSHRFPVEISIPKNRIINMVDVSVEVASFDYELPTIDCLKINAALHIHGISKDEIIEEVEEEKELKQAEEEITEEVTHTEQNTPIDVEETMREEPTSKEEMVKDIEKEKAIDEENRGKEENTEKMEVKTEQTEKEEITTKEQETNVEIITEEEDTIDIQLSETEETGEEAEKVKDVLFLTDLFGGAQEEMKTSIKIHITQEEDTVETIAKRYEVSTLQLMKENNLSPEDISEGMLLEIPSHQE